MSAQDYAHRGNTGFLLLRHHDASFDPALRAVMVGARAGGTADRFGSGFDKYGQVQGASTATGEEPTHGDIQLAAMWQFDPSPPDGSPSRGIPGWGWAWPAVVEHPFTESGLSITVGGATIFSTSSASSDPFGGVPSDMAMVTGTKGVAPVTTSVRTVYSNAWDKDLRFVRKSVALPPGLTGVPNNTPGIVIPGTKESSQDDLFMPIGASGPLIAVNAAGDFHLGTLVADLTPASEIDLAFRARLQTAWRVVRPEKAAAAPPPVSTYSKDPVAPTASADSFDWPSHNGLAWQLGPPGFPGDAHMGYGLCCAPPSVDTVGAAKKPPPDPGGGGDGRGGGGGSAAFYNAWRRWALSMGYMLTPYGAYTGGLYTPGASLLYPPYPGDSGPPPPPPDPVADAGVSVLHPATGLALAVGGVGLGGPLDVGGMEDIHRLTISADGEPVNSLHIPTMALFRDQYADAGLEFQHHRYDPVVRLPYLVPTHLRFDDKRKHVWGAYGGPLGEKPGLWRWQSEADKYQSCDNSVGGGGCGTGIGGGPAGGDPFAGTGWINIPGAQAAFNVNMRAARSAVDTSPLRHQPPGAPVLTPLIGRPPVAALAPPPGTPYAPTRPAPSSPVGNTPRTVPYAPGGLANRATRAGGLPGTKLPLPVRAPRLSYLHPNATAPASLWRSPGGRNAGDPPPQPPRPSWEDVLAPDLDSSLLNPAPGQPGGERPNADAQPWTGYSPVPSPALRAVDPAGAPRTTWATPLEQVRAVQLFRATPPWLNDLRNTARQALNVPAQLDQVAPLVCRLEAVGSFPVAGATTFVRAPGAGRYVSGTGQGGILFTQPDFGLDQLLAGRTIPTSPTPRFWFYGANLAFGPPVGATGLTQSGFELYLTGSTLNLDTTSATGIGTTALTVDNSTQLVTAKATLRCNKDLSANGSSGTAGQVLTSGGAGAAMSWTTISASTNFDDSTFYIFNHADNTKHLAFSAGSIATGTTRTLTAPDLSGTIATVDGGQTFTSATWHGTIVGQAYGGTGLDTSGVTNGQLLIGNTTGNAWVRTTLTGSTNQVNVGLGAGSITLTLPQQIGTSSSVQFGSVNASTFGAGTAAVAAQALTAGGSYTDTSGTDKNVRIAPAFADGGGASSTSVWEALEVAPTINATATARTGHYEALRIRVTETSLPTGTNYLLRCSAGAAGATDIFTVDNAGNVSITGKLTVSGQIDPTALILSSGTNLFLESNDGSTAGVSGAHTGRQRYVDASARWEESVQAGSWLPRPMVRASARATGQTAANTSVATYTAGGADGTFVIYANVNVTASTTFSFSVQVAYTDETGAAQTLTLNLQNLAATILSAITNVQGTGPYEGIPVTIRAQNGTAITVKTAGTFTSVTYNVEAHVHQIA